MVAAGLDGGNDALQHRLNTVAGRAVTCLWASAAFFASVSGSMFPSAFLNCVAWVATDPPVLTSVPCSGSQPMRG